MFPLNLSTSAKDLKAKLQTSERDYLSQPWHFGFSPEMKGGGPEFAFLAALKVHVMGRRLLFFTPYDKAREWAAAKSPDASKQSPTVVLDYLCNADKSDMQTLVEMNAIHKCTVTPGSFLFVPWGYIVIDMSMNSEENAGLSWLLVQEASSPAFEALCSDVIPDKETMKGSTALSFLVRIMHALYSGPDPKRIDPGHKYKGMQSIALKVKMESIQAVAKATKKAKAEHPEGKKRSLPSSSSGSTQAATNQRT